MIECPICSSPRARSLYHVKGIDVMECEHCSQVFVPTLAPEFNVIYKESYFNNTQGPGYQNYRSEFTSHLVTFSARIEESEKELGGRVGRLLDVGCALGHLGEAARRRGWDVYVTDVSEYAVQQSRESFGLNGFITNPNKLPVKPACFDLITVFEVLEHLSHPLDLIKNIRRSLSSHGILHIVTPNVKSLSARLLGKNWYYFKPKEHFLYFTPETIRSILERCGFEVLKIKAAAKHMRIADLILRFERYSHWGAKLLRWIARFFNLSDIRLKLFTGEMQIWARPAELRMVVETRPVTDIIDIVCCPNCRSEIQLFEDSEAICTQCELSFEVRSGVINFSKYAKRTNHQRAGKA